MSARMDDVRAALELYVRERIPTGGFLEAVLANDLRGALNRADDTSLANLPEIVRLVRHLPPDCHGSYVAVREWLERAP